MGHITNVEITPEMIEAGMGALRGSELDCPTEKEQRAMVARVFIAMRQAVHESDSTDCRP